MLATIGAVLQLVLLILSKVFEKDAAKKKQKEEIQTELTNALKAKDTSAITAALDRINRLR